MPCLAQRFEDRALIEPGMVFDLVGHERLVAERRPPARPVRREKFEIPIWRVKPRRLASQRASICSFSGTAGARPVDEEEIDLLDPKPLQARLRRTLERAVAGVGRPDLRGDEDLLARRALRADRLADLHLVAVHGRRVDVPIAGVERRMHGAGCRRRRGAPRCRTRAPGSPPRSTSQSVSSLSSLPIDQFEPHQRACFRPPRDFLEAGGAKDRCDADVTFAPDELSLGLERTGLDDRPHAASRQRRARRRAASASGFSRASRSGCRSSSPPTRLRRHRAARRHASGSSAAASRAVRWRTSRPPYRRRKRECRAAVPPRRSRGSARASRRAAPPSSRRATSATTCTSSRNWRRAPARRDRRDHPIGRA